MKKSTKIIYVVDNEMKYVGCITLGNVLKDTLESRKWVNINSKRVIHNEDEEVEVKQIFDTYNYINYIPVIEKETGKLLHEFQSDKGNFMNCNPFTLGHQYLIEYAANRAAFIYIFVVEEDKSYFEFEDRIQLVREGVSHLKNVIVLPSGRFMISMVTFPGYFEKDRPKQMEVDTTFDLNLFCSYIAPGLGIVKRFVGEEPIDIVTKRYNENMKKVLPEHNIEVIEIPRKQNKGQVISASRVRKLLEEERLEVIKELVPISTYNYLKNRK